MKTSLRFAMETWGLSAYLQNELPTAHVAEVVMRNIETKLGTRGTVHEIGCSYRDQSVYDIFIHFDFPPAPEVAIEVLGQAFEGLSILTLDLINPFSYSSSVVHDVSLDKLGNALKRIKQHQELIKKDVVSGAQFHRISNNSLYNV